MNAFAAKPVEPSQLLRRDADRAALEPNGRVAAIADERRLLVVLRRDACSFGLPRLARATDHRNGLGPNSMKRQPRVALLDRSRVAGRFR